jgi:hypothetical protein
LLARLVITLLLAVNSHAAQKNCGVYLYKLQKKVKEAVPKANQQRKNELHLTVKSNWKYKLAKFIGDEAMSNTMERAMHKMRIDPKLTIDAIWTKEFDKFEWLDVLENFSRSDIKTFLRLIENTSQNHLTFYENYTELINGLIKRKVLTFNEARAFLSKIENPNIMFTFSNARKQVFFDVDFSESQVSQIYDMLEKSNLSEEMKQEWSVLLLYKFPRQEVMDVFNKEIAELPNDPMYIELFSNYLDYLTGLKTKEASKVAKGVSSLLSTGVKKENYFSQMFSSRLLRKLKAGDPAIGFYRQEKRVNKLRNKLRDEKFKKYTKNNGTHLSKRQIIKIEEEVASESAHYRNVLNQCARNKNGLTKSKPKSAMEKRNTKRFTHFKIGAGLTLAAAMYSVNHWDEPERKELSEWHGKLGYDMFWTIVFAFTKAVIYTAKSTTFVGKYATTLFTGAGFDTLYSGGFEILFGIKASEAEEKYKELMKDPNFKKRVDELAKEFQEQRVAQKFVKYINEKFKGKSLPSGQNLLDAIETAEDLEKPEVKEAIIQLLTREMYEVSKENSLIKTGSKASDMWTFHRFWGTLSDVKSVALGLYIYNMLCRNAHNPGAAYFKASMVVIVDRIIHSAVYYATRERAIGE